jgi:hypothetical protein
MTVSGSKCDDSTAIKAYISNGILYLKWINDFFFDKKDGYLLF